MRLFSGSLLLIVGPYTPLKKYHLEATSSDVISLSVLLLSKSIEITYKYVYSYMMYAFQCDNVLLFDKNSIAFVENIFETSSIN